MLRIASRKAAPKRRRRAEEPPRAEMEMTPMIDVTFLLLIFFMCTIQFKTLEGKLAAYLPKDAGQNPTSPREIEPISVLLSVAEPGNRIDPRTGADWNGSGRYTFDRSRAVQYRVGPRSFDSLEQVGQRLKELHNQDPSRPVKIDARPGTIYADVVRVLDSATRAGFSNVNFSGSYE